MSVRLLDDLDFVLYLAEKAVGVGQQVPLPVGNEIVFGKQSERDERAAHA